MGWDWIPLFGVAIWLSLFPKTATLQTTSAEYDALAAEQRLLQTQKERLLRSLTCLESQGRDHRERYLAVVREVAALTSGPGPLGKGEQERRDARLARLRVEATSLRREGTRLEDERKDLRNRLVNVRNALLGVEARMVRLQPPAMVPQPSSPGK